MLTHWSWVSIWNRPLGELCLLVLRWLNWTIGIYIYIEGLSQLYNLIVIHTVRCEKSHDGDTVRTEVLRSPLIWRQLRRIPRSNPSLLPQWKSHWWRDVIMNRQRDAEGENANQWPERWRGGRGWGKGALAGRGQRHAATMRLIPPASLRPLLFLSKEERRALGMSSEMKRWLWKGKRNKKVKYVIRRFSATCDFTLA